MKNEEEHKEKLNGLKARHVAQIIRRKMVQRDHGDKSKYSRKQKHKGNGEDC